jgi:hypothetical protein
VLQLPVGAFQQSWGSFLLSQIWLQPLDLASSLVGGLQG